MSREDLSALDWAIGVLEGMASGLTGFRQNIADKLIDVADRISAVADHMREIGGDEA